MHKAMHLLRRVFKIQLFVKRLHIQFLLSAR